MSVRARFKTKTFFPSARRRRRGHFQIFTLYPFSYCFVYGKTSTVAGYCISAATRGLLKIPPTHMCPHPHPTLLCLPVDTSIHTTSFPATPSIPLLKQASFAVSFLTFFFSYPLSLCLFQTLTGCADFGSLLFSANSFARLPSFTSFRENAVRHQTDKKKKKKSILVVYSF